MAGWRCCSGWCTARAGCPGTRPSAHLLFVAAIWKRRRWTRTAPGSMALGAWPPQSARRRRRRPIARPFCSAPRSGSALAAWGGRTAAWRWYLPLFFSLWQRLGGCCNSVHQFVHSGTRKARAAARLSRRAPAGVLMRSCLLWRVRRRLAFFVGVALGLVAVRQRGAQAILFNSPA